ncbi:MAG TPA: hypothetical protein VLK84_10460 [Longimicrobium sp.]|nr:hypothetical protein [Longimicrobium sp.]
MRRTWMVAAACALAACGSGPGGGADARAADDVADSAAARGDTAAAGSAAADTAMTFRLHETQPGTADSITVTRGGRVVQALLVSENHVPPESRVERIHRIDLDFDGTADVGFVTELSMAGSRSEYWRLDPRTGRLDHAGVYETLQPDSAARELTTYIRGGHAGRLWTASRWRWVDGALAEVRQEEQDVQPDGEGYVRIVRERRNGALAETSRDTLADAGPGTPSWAKP